MSCSWLQVQEIGPRMSSSLLGVRAVEPLVVVYASRMSTKQIQGALSPQLIINGLGVDITQGHSSYPGQ